MKFHSSLSKLGSWSLLALLFPSLWGQSFQNVATEQGIYHTFGYHTFGGGVSFFDFSGDGLDDLSFATDMGYEPSFYRNTSLGFAKVTLAGVSHLGASRQLLWVDMDNDGDQDLYLTATDGPNHLFRNDGSLNFTDITAEAGLSMESMPSYGACWGDYDRDGFLDLLTANRMENNDFLAYYLYRNKGDGTFEDKTQSAGLANSATLSFMPVFVDLNHDLFPEIYLANDKQKGNVLYRNEGDGTFTDISQASGAGVIMDGMGIAAADYDGDNDLDLYITNTPDGNVLLRNNGNETFTDVSDSAGVRVLGFCWGVNFLDMDHDADLDLYASAIHSVGGSRPSSTLLLNQGDGTFVPNGQDSMFADTAFSYSNALGDFNRDGYWDIGVNNLSPYLSSVWKNKGGHNHWLKYRLRGTVSNRDGIGTWVETYAGGNRQVRYSQSGLSYLGQNSAYEIVGLGTNIIVDSVIVHWPSGLVNHYGPFDHNKTITLVEEESVSGMISPARQKVLEMQLFPIPAHDKIHLQWTMPQVGVATFRVLDLRGKQVQEKKVQLTGQAGEQLSWDVSDLPAGTYLLEYLPEQGGRVVKRFQRW